jgi:hypothetical protein
MLKNTSINRKVIRKIALATRTGSGFQRLAKKVWLPLPSCVAPTDLMP